MGMRKLPSNWLNDADDQSFIRKSTSMGSHIVGDSIAERIPKMAETPVQCSEGHVFKLLDAPDSGYCPHAICKGKKNHLMVKGQPLNDTDDGMDDVERTGRGIARKSDQVPTGGVINLGKGEEPIYTSKNKIRKPFVR